MLGIKIEYKINLHGMFPTAIIVQSSNKFIQKPSRKVKFNSWGFFSLHIPNYKCKTNCMPDLYLHVFEMWNV